MYVPKKSEYVKFKNFERRKTSQFKTYVDSESVVVPEDNGKQSRNESYTNKYQKYVATSYDYKIVFIHSKFIINHT